MHLLTEAGTSLTVSILAQQAAAALCFPLPTPNCSEDLGCTEIFKPASDKSSFKRIKTTTLMQTEATASVLPQLLFKTGQHHMEQSRRDQEINPPHNGAQDLTQAVGGRTLLFLGFSTYVASVFKPESSQRWLPGCALVSAHPALYGD